ncbi:cholinesterase 1-like [Mercenaria mercenaria]|uniref:cholinesterase 1-like n=1 Tax=Mercenaria mercenaria TaxID=6596 RepID=UPI00234FA7E1|nr:cholinesterase 1-like [Mercenaria mercenaria]
METMKIVYMCSLISVYTCIHSKDIVIKAPAGNILGRTSTVHFAGQPYTISSYLGIPFAESTNGQRRFSKPVIKARFVGTFNATEAKLSCPQNVKWEHGLEQIPVGEDCLNLNIFAPSGIPGKKPKAVMIYIYGGAFQYGFQNAYISTALVALHDVIYVTFNYRVSHYGFLASKKHGLKGNYGLWDQHMAIQWVHDNIAAFGGDPNRVTLFGDSAGAASVIYQAMYEGNKGRIQRVIAQSGTVCSFWSFDRYPDLLFEDLSTKSGCKKRTFQETMKCLRAMDIEAKEKHMTFEADFLPVYDGEFIKYKPDDIFGKQSLESASALRNFADVDIIIGLNSEEGLTELEALARMSGDNLEIFSDGMSEKQMKAYTDQLFKEMNKTHNDILMKSVLHQYTDWSDPQSDTSRRSMFLDLLKDVHYTDSTVKTVNAHVSLGSHGNTYMYHFDHKPSFSVSPKWVDGADHTEEIPFVLGFPRFYMYLFGKFYEDPPLHIPQNELHLSKAMMKYWTQFAKTGNPNVPDDVSVTEWPTYTANNHVFLILKADENSLQTGSLFRNQFVRYWADIYPGLSSLAMNEKQTKEDNTEAKTCKLVSSASAPLQFVWKTICVSLILFYFESSN